jgi:hypothetical protein
MQMVQHRRVPGERLVPHPEAGICLSWTDGVGANRGIRVSAEPIAKDRHGMLGDLGLELNPCGTMTYGAQV